MRGEKEEHSGAWCFGASCVGCTDAAGGLCSRINLSILGGRTGGWWRWWRERWWLVVAVMVVVVVCEGGTSVTNE